MTSIKNKVFITFVGLMLGYVIVVILINSLFLEKYYFYRSESSFVKYYQEVQSEIRQNRNGVSDLLFTIDREEGIHGLIIDRYLKIHYDSLPMSKSPGMRIPVDLANYIRINGRQLETTGYSYGIIKYPEFGTENAAFMARLNNGLLLIFEKSMTSIDQSSQVANEFFAIVGFVILAVGSILIYVFSKQLTAPIIQLTNMAAAIANLDFNDQFEVKSKDEIGLLGMSMNKISAKLSKTIDELSQANKALKEDLEKEKEIDQMRKEFIRNVSHELKTPIGVIKGYAEGLKYGVANNIQKSDKYCDVIINVCDNMNKMVKDLLELSRMDAGKLLLEMTVFDLQTLTADVLERLKPIIDDNGIIIREMHQVEGEALVQADYTRIGQAFQNYLINAIEHVDSQKILNISISKRGNYWRVAVYNTGAPIPADKSEQIWQVFYKLDKARTRSIGGSGLGLAIVKSIINQHGGTYGFENLENGVEFYFELVNHHKTIT
jgi:signal transduction histidine kinase